MVVLSEALQHHTEAEMAYFDWDKKYEIGVGRMDLQHQGLIRLMNQLHMESKSGARKSQLLATLTELTRLTEKHFAEEEQYMRSISYSGLKSHSMIHTQLISSLKDHATNFSAAAVQNIPDSMFTFLKLWLSSHILGIDTQYAKEAKEGAA